MDTLSSTGRLGCRCECLKFTCFLILLHTCLTLPVNANGFTKSPSNGRIWSSFGQNETRRHKTDQVLEPLVNNNQSSINNWPSLVKYLPRVPPVFGSHLLHLPSKTSTNKDTSSSPNLHQRHNLTHFDNESNINNVNTSITKLNSTSSSHFMLPSNNHRSHLFDTPDTSGSLDPDLISLVTSSPLHTPSSIFGSNSLLSTPIAPSTSLPSEIEDWIKLTDHELSQILADGPPVPPSPPSELVDTLGLNQANGNFPNSLLNSQLQNEQSPGLTYPTSDPGHSRFSGNGDDKFSRNPYVDGHVQRSVAPSRYGGYHNNRRPPPNYNSKYKPPPSIPYQPPARSQFNKNSHTNRINVNSGRGTLTPVYKHIPSTPTLAGGPVRPGNRRLDPETRFKNTNYPPYNVNTRFRNRGSGNSDSSNDGQSNHGNSDDRNGRGRFFGMPNAPGRHPKKKPGPSNTYYPEGGRFNWNHVDTTTTTASPKLTTSKVSFDDHRYDFGYGGHKDNGRDIGQTAYDEGRRRKGKKNKKFKPSYSDNPINQDGQGFGFPNSSVTTEKPTLVTTTKTTIRPSDLTTVSPSIVTSTTANPITTTSTTSIGTTTTTTAAPEIATTKKVANELKQALDEINELRGQLEIEESKLNEMKIEARKFSVKLKQMIKRTRRRQLYFYDTLLEKTLRYNEDIHVDRIKSQIASIREAKALLDSKVTRSTPWKARYVTKRIRGQDLVNGSKKLLSETKSRIVELDKVLKDLAREKQL